MSDKVRVHLNQAILVGYGEEARYAKVLIGQRPDSARISDEFQPFVIFGYVRGYRGYNLEQPTRLRLATDNILAIEDCKVERVCCDVHPDGCEGYVHHKYTFAHQAGVLVYQGTPDSLWGGHGPHQVSLHDVGRARRSREAGACRHPGGRSRRKAPHVLARLQH